MIDYNAEIPFEKQPPIGFFDTSEDVAEDDRHNFKRLRREDVEGVRRDVEEAVSGLWRELLWGYGEIGRSIRAWSLAYLSGEPF